MVAVIAGTDKIQNVKICITMEEAKKYIEKEIQAYRDVFGDEEILEMKELESKYKFAANFVLQVDYAIYQKDVEKIMWWKIVENCEKAKK